MISKTSLLNVLAALFLLLWLGREARAQSPEIKAEHHVVYHRPDEFAGWPANEGLWSWGDEILVGFNVAKFEERGDKHSFTGRQGIAFARSLDGGVTWTVETHENVMPPAMLASPGRAKPAPGGIEFTHPDFAMKLRGRYFFTSSNRGKNWEGAFRIPDFGQGMDARTSYLVTGKSSCLFFIPCSVSDGRGTRIRSCAVQTEDGGRTFHFLSWIGPDPMDEAGPGVTPSGDDISSTMPSVVRMDDGRLVCALRHRVKRRKWSSIQESTDGGRSWQPVAELEKGATNPISLVRLGGDRLVAVYGSRRKVPCSLCAKTSDDGGRTWSPEIILRNDGRKWDLGYTRAAMRTDGQVVVLYYYSTDSKPQQHIEATIWRP